MREVAPAIERAVGEAMREVESVVPFVAPMPVSVPMPQVRPLPSVPRLPRR
jgi:hypothetical protein